MGCGGEAQGMPSRAEPSLCLVVQFEAAWVLSNICSGTMTHTMTVLNHGALEPLVKLLTSPDEDVSDQVCHGPGVLRPSPCILRARCCFVFLLSLFAAVEVPSESGANCATANASAYP